MTDKRPYEVLDLLKQAGWSLRQLAFANGYQSATSLNRALYESAPKSEQIIANAIGKTRQEIWPSRVGEVGKPGRKKLRPANVVAA